MKIYQARNKTCRVASVWHRFGTLRGGIMPPREEGGLWVTALLTLWNPKQRGLGTPRDRNTGPSHLVQATSLEGPHPVSPAAIGAPWAPGAQAADQGGHVGSAAVLRARSTLLSAPGARTARASGERFLPLCSAPVLGNLRSVTRILRRATCSPGCAAGAASQAGPAAWVPRAPEAMRVLARRGGRLPLLGKAPCPLPALARRTPPPPRSPLPSFAPSRASGELGCGSPTPALALLRSAPLQSPGRRA